MSPKRKKGKGKKQRKTDNTPPVQKLPEPPIAVSPSGGQDPPLRRVWRAASRWAGCSWKVIVATGVIVGILVAIPTFWPRLSISAEPPLRERDLLSTPFLISNNGFLPLRDVWITCQVDTLATSLGQLIQNARPVERLLDPDLSPGESLTFGCIAPNWTGNVIGTAGRQQLVRLSIEIRYRPFGIPFVRRRHEEGFRSEPAHRGLLRWTRLEPIPIWRPDYNR
jgi:hypothetical protein